MSNTIKNTFIFAMGAAVGSVVTWKLIKTKYEQLAQEEIDDVKEKLSKLKTEPKEQVKPVEEKKKNNNEDLAAKYDSILKKYTRSDLNAHEKVVEKDIMNKPYIISPAEFGEKDEYEQISLSYYSDGFLVDEDDEIVEDVERTVGEDFHTHFGEYEDDSVYVRNDIYKADYEILVDTRKYSDVIKKKKPHNTED